MAWWCPVCGCRQPNESSLCSGSFLDTDHPSNVRPIDSPPDAALGLGTEGTS